MPGADALLLADSLVAAELWGHSSHGMLRLPWYVERLRSGAMSATTEPEILIDSGALVLLDGRDGIGQVLAARAIDLGVERARAHGVSAVAVRNSNHFGTAAYFTRQAAEAGCVAFLSTNASPAMAPWGGRTKAVGTNPWSIAAPAGRRGVAVMDIANTAVARGKIYLAAERGETIPAGWAADETGTPTTDAAQAVHGLILPMAGHKGYVISFMMDVLAGVLTGSSFGRDVAGPVRARQAQRLRSPAADHRRVGADAAGGVRRADGGVDRPDQGGAARRRGRATSSSPVNSRTATPPGTRPPASPSPTTPGPAWPASRTRPASRCRPPPTPHRDAR